VGHINIEIKAKCADQKFVRDKLNEFNPRFIGIDHQIDTYFNINRGRLKLREGKIENHLIYYEREDGDAPKQSDVVLFDYDPKSSLKNILTTSLGVKVVVNKKREIYFINNMKFHIDEVKGLGLFVEIEAIDKEGLVGKEKLLKQCNHYINLFKIKKGDLISCSYSDMLLSSYSENGSIVTLTP